MAGRGRCCCVLCRTDEDLRRPHTTSTDDHEGKHDVLEGSVTWPTRTASNDYFAELSASPTTVFYNVATYTKPNVIVAFSRVVGQKVRAIFFGLDEDDHMAFELHHYDDITIGRFMRVVGGAETTIQQYELPRDGNSINTLQVCVKKHPTSGALAVWFQCQGKTAYVLLVSFTQPGNSVGFSLNASASGYIYDAVYGQAGPADYTEFLGGFEDCMEIPCVFYTAGFTGTSATLDLSDWPTTWGDAANWVWFGSDGLRMDSVGGFLGYFFFPTSVCVSSFQLPAHGGRVLNDVRLIFNAVSADNHHFLQITESATNWFKLELFRRVSGSDGSAIWSQTINYDPAGAEFSQELLFDCAIDASGNIDISWKVETYDTTTFDFTYYTGTDTVASTLFSFGHSIGAECKDAGDRVRLWWMQRSQHPDVQLRESGWPDCVIDPLTSA